MTRSPRCPGEDRRVRHAGGWRWPVVIIALAVLAGGCAEYVLRKSGARRAAGVTELSVVVASDARSASGAWGGYRGRLEEVRHEGRLLLVNHVSLEDYVKGVLPGEIPTGWSFEALKAMAVVARTYAWFRWQTRAGDKFQLMADSRDQQYCGLKCEEERSNRAVETTAGLVLVYDGKILPAYCHSCCAGATEDIREVWGGASVPALKGVKCRWCAQSPHYGPWTLIITRDALGRRLQGELGSPAGVDWIKTEGTTASGRVKQVVVGYAGKTARMSGAKFRSIVGFNDLRSTKFKARINGGEVDFRGTGWGHGVGLCQEGAGGMAAGGNGYREILRHYFPGSEIRRLKR